MGFFEDMFEAGILFDSEHKQRADINALRAEVSALSQPDAQVAALARRVSQLSLLCNALVQIVERKGLATREELEVLVQQIDLLDGREDGWQNTTVWQNAPRCTSCNHYINPDREACIYCGQPIPRTPAGGGGPYRGGSPAGSEPAPRTAPCAKCANRVPQSDLFFTEQGELWCSSCFL